MIGLGLFGSFAGPHWSPEPLSAQITVQAEQTAIGGLDEGAAGGGAGAAPALGAYHVATSVVTVQLDGVRVQAEVYAPVGRAEPSAGVLFVHGAGTGLHTAFDEQARALASAGIVALVPDKRLDTYSTRHRDYVAMAADYRRSLDVLRGWPGVDPARVGVYGESEGAWIAPVVARGDVAFVVLVSAPVVRPREQAAFAVDNYLRNTGVPGALFRAIPRIVGMQVPGGGFEYADFDATPYLQRLTQPVLVVYGTADQAMPLVQGTRAVIDDLAVAGNDDYTVRFYAGADHGIRMGGTHAPFAPGYLRDLAAWVGGLPGTAGAEPKIAGAEPVQRFAAAPVPAPHWFAEGDALVVVAVGGVGAILLGPLTAGLAALLGRRGRGLAPWLRRPAIGLGAGCLLTLAALVAYVAVVAELALTYRRNPLLVVGGWYLVRFAGIATVAQGVVLAERLLDTRRRSAGPVVASGTAALGLGGLLAGSVVVLGMLAYWGVFPLAV